MLFALLACHQPLLDVQATGGGVGVECSPMEANNPGVGNFLYQSSHQFSATASVTLTTDIGPSYLSVFPVHFAVVTNGYFFPLLSLPLEGGKKFKPLSTFL